MSNCDETNGSLQYAERAKTIQNDVKKSADSTEVANLKKVIATLSEELERHKGGLAALE